MKFLQNSYIEWLLSHSYGQGGMVALPFSNNPSKQSLRGEFPAGVQDVLNRLGDQYGSWPSANPVGTDVEWCFLIGGPGNGKSEALKLLAGALMVELPPAQLGQPAPRAIPINWPTNAAPIVGGLEIVFINDASIPRKDALNKDQSGSLFLDFRDGINRLINNRVPVILFANVNRGVLVEEKSKLDANSCSQSSNVDKLVAEIIEWISAPPTEAPSSSNASGLQTIVPIHPANPYYGQFHIPLKSLGSHHDINVHVVFLDALSLLEPTPGNGKVSINFLSSVPVVSKYQPFGNFSDKGAAREKTVAGKLLTLLVKEEEWENGSCASQQDGQLCAAFKFCPLVQNAIVDPNVKTRKG